MFIIDVDVLTRSKLIDLLKRKNSKTRMMPRFGINIGNEVEQKQEVLNCLEAVVEQNEE